MHSPRLFPKKRNSKTKNRETPGNIYKRKENKLIPLFRRLKALRRKNKKGFNVKIKRQERSFYLAKKEKAV